jgi:hypothetical protein
MHGGHYIYQFKRKFQPSKTDKQERPKPNMKNQSSCSDSLPQTNPALRRRTSSFVPLLLNLGGLHCASPENGIGRDGQENEKCSFPKKNLFERRLTKQRPNDLNVNRKDWFLADDTRIVPLEGNRPIFNNVSTMFFFATD